MKMTKKVVSLLLVLLMAFGLCSAALAAPADPAYRVEADKEQVQVGDTVTLNIYGFAATVYGVEFKVSFDEAAFEVVSSTLENPALKKNGKTPSSVTIGVASMNPIEVEGGLWATVVLKAKQAGPATLHYRGYAYEDPSTQMKVGVPQDQTITIVEELAQKLAYTVGLDKFRMEVGELLTLQVKGFTAQVSGVEFTLSYDSSKLELVSSTLETSQLEKNQQDPGRVVIGVAKYDPFQLEGGLWATVVLRAKASGVAALQFSGLAFDGSHEELPTAVPDDQQITIFQEALKPLDSTCYFADVHGVNHWACQAVDFAVSQNLFKGVSDTLFAPDSPMTRAMLMTVLARLDGQDTTGGSTWYEKGMAWAVQSGISDGSNPQGNITREQLAAMLHRYAKSPAPTGSLDGFPDGMDTSGYAVEPMEWAVGLGLINGMDGRLQPGGSATRAQVAAILMRYVQSLEA